MPISTNRDQLEKDKFVDDGSGNAAVRILLTNGGSLEIDSVVYVASTAVVSGTRDGSFTRPFELYQDAIDAFGVPTTQAEYELRKQIIFLDGADYAEDVLFPMGIWEVQFGLATHTGTMDWEINSAERFGSSQAPRMNLIKDVTNIQTGITGDIEVYLKSGGSAVSTLYFNASGMIINGNVTIADGTNLGTSCSSLPIVSFYRATISSGGNFKNRLCFFALTQSNLSSSSVDLEIGLLNSAQNSTINATYVLEARSSASTKTIRDLTLNTSGGVTWDSTGSVRNWNVDPPSANEIINKITSYPSNTINLIKVGAEAIGYDNTTSGLAAEDVQDAIDELAAIDGDYLPLAGGTMAGDLDMDSNNISNVLLFDTDRLKLAKGIVNATPFNMKDTTPTVASVVHTATAAVAVNLPAIDSTVDERIWIIKDSGYNAATNNITLTPNGSDTIEGLGSYVMNADGQSIIIYCNRDTNNWEVN